MTTTLTDNYSFPQFSSGDPANWAASMNGFLVDIDRLVAEADGTLIWDGNTNGRVDGSEILTYDGEPLGYV